MRRPSVHQAPPLLKQITTPVRGFYFVSDNMRQRRLSDLAREVDTLGRPMTKRGVEAMRSSTGAVSLGEQSYVKAPCRHARR
jgi:hypothetical protein